MKTILIKITAPLLILLSLSACKETSADTTSNVGNTSEEVDIYTLPEWAKDAVIYEVNVRQFTPEGTFKALESHLERINELGADILWLMPIFPISETKRKGSLGSYYAVSDYKGLNPNFGSPEDFKSLVNKIHELGMYVILDFVPNHTGWDSPWIKKHPEWYTQDSLGNILDPLDPSTGESWGWTDVADLNYDNKEMRAAMIEAFQFWVSEYNVDGFRQDVAHQVPPDFWKTATDALLPMKSLFLLAEAEVPAIRNNRAFHADYGWEFHHLINEIAHSKKTAADIQTWMTENRTKYKEGFHMHFTSNHDENTWAGTVFDRLGNAHKALAILTFTFEGMPLIYGGQEEPLRHRLKFFEKDDIGFQNYEYTAFYKQLCELKTNNPALWNGKFGSEPQIEQADNQLLVFNRVKDNNKLKCIFNLSDSTATFIAKEKIKGTDLLSDEALSIDSLQMEPWSYKIVGL